MRLQQRVFIDLTYFSPRELRESTRLNLLCLLSLCIIFQPLDIDFVEFWALLFPPAVTFDHSIMLSWQSILNPGGKWGSMKFNINGLVHEPQCVMPLMMKYLAESFLVTPRSVLKRAKHTDLIFKKCIRCIIQFSLKIISDGVLDL